IYIIPDRLAKFLRENGYNPEEIIPAWAERQWLETQGGRHQKRIRINGQPTWCIAIRRSAVEELEN
ncbi:hypothetical protein, partial [Alicyclobacillus suci]|uniref:hypothetical protein n=1 Tax=Alicyclobacillus suci TaxID=2816080 RepID=UPI001A8FB451